MNRSRMILTIVGAAVLGALLMWLVLPSSSSSNEGTPTAQTTSRSASPWTSRTATAERTTAAASPTTNNGSGGQTDGQLAPASPTTNLSTITVGELPSQAQQTLSLIASGGPFPYRKDGTVFSNRERVLPQQRSGFYTEYTVETPGSSDRGARRIVAGQNGSRFYTDDHYQSFSEVIQ